MSVIEVNFLNTRFSLNCDDVELVKNTAAHLDANAKNMVAAYPNGISDLKALFLTAMLLQDKLLNAESALVNGKPDDSQAMATVLDRVSNYVTDLANLIEK